MLGDAVSLRDVAAVAGRSPAEVVTRSSATRSTRSFSTRTATGWCFATSWSTTRSTTTFPAAARRLLHREAAARSRAAGADPLEVADQLVLGAERGDEEAIGWLRDAAGDASARAPAVAVELLRRAEALLPGGHPDADLLSSEVVGALLRAGQVADASARAEAVLARQHDPAVDLPLRVALLGALALQNRAEELIEVARVGLGAPGLGPFDRCRCSCTRAGRGPTRATAGAGRCRPDRALGIAEAADVAPMAVASLTALLIALGRQGRYGEALGHARRSAALAAHVLPPGSMPLQPKLFLGLASFDCDLVDEARAAYRAALDDEFGSGWWLSDTLTADAQASFAVGEWDDAVPGLIAGGQAAREKDHPLLLSQSVAHRAVIATPEATTVPRGAGRGDRPVVDGDELSYNAGVVASRWPGWRRPRATSRAPTTSCCGAGGSRWRGTTASTTVASPPIWFAWPWRSVIATSRSRWPAPSRPTSPWPGGAHGPQRVAAMPGNGRARGRAVMLEAVAIAREHTAHGRAHRSLRGRGPLLTDSGRRDEAVTLLAEALERHERAGAEAWAGRVRASAAGLGVRPGGEGRGTGQ